MLPEEKPAQGAKEMCILRHGRQIKIEKRQCCFHHFYLLKIDKDK